MGGAHDFTVFKEVISLRKKFLPVAALLIFAMTAPAFAALYENARFGYSVDVPDDFEWLPEAANGDGRVFKHKADPDFTITFHARVRQGDDDTLAKEGANLVPSGAAEADPMESGPSYYVSFTKNGIYADALIFLVDGVFYSATARWPKAEDARFKPVSGSVLRTWKIHGSPTVY
jgi:hypothetical protein